MVSSYAPVALQLTASRSHRFSRHIEPFVAEYTARSVSEAVSEARMTRPREYTVDAVVEAAMGAFWERGYQGTGITDLEQRTCVNRSSLYHAFGSKEALFRDSLDSYIQRVVDPLLAPMEDPEASVADVVGFFSGLAASFRDEASPTRNGCLWVNTVSEFAGRPAPVDTRAAEFRERLPAAFANALQ